MVEAAGVELFSVLITRKLLILGIAKTAKKAPLPDPLYVYCTKIRFALEPLTPYRDTVSHGFGIDGTRKNTQLSKQRTLDLGRFHRYRAFCVVIDDMVDPRADRKAPHGASVARLQHF